MRLDPIDGAARPQFVALERMMAPEMLYLAKDPGAPDIKVSIAIDGHEIARAVDVTADAYDGTTRLACETKTFARNT